MAARSCAFMFTLERFQERDAVGVDVDQCVDTTTERHLRRGPLRGGFTRNELTGHRYEQRLVVVFTVQFNNAIEKEDQLSQPRRLPKEHRSWRLPSP